MLQARWRKSRLRIGRWSCLGANGVLGLDRTGQIRDGSKEEPRSTGPGQHQHWINSIVKRGAGRARLGKACMDGCCAVRAGPGRCSLLYTLRRHRVQTGPWQVHVKAAIGCGTLAGASRRANQLTASKASRCHPCPLVLVEGRAMGPRGCNAAIDGWSTGLLGWMSKF